MGKNLNVTDAPFLQPHYVETPQNVFDAEMAKDMAKRTEKLQDTTIDLALRVKQAREFLMWSNNHIRNEWMDWVEQSETIAKNMNEFRMAFDRESKHIIATGKDISSYFNSDDYTKGLNALKETVATLDKFNQLRQNGTLDAFADFILKTSCK